MNKSPVDNVVTVSGAPILEGSIIAKPKKGYPQMRYWWVAIPDTPRWEALGWSVTEEELNGNKFRYVTSDYILMELSVSNGRQKVYPPCGELE